MTRQVKKNATLFSIAALVILVPFALRAARINAVAAVALAAVTLPVETSLASMMIRAGLAPEALCAVGVSANQVASIVGAFKDAVAAEPMRLAQADAAYSAAKTESDRLRRLIESGRGSAADVTAYQSEMQALSAASSARAAALADFRADAIASLQSAQGTTIATLSANHDFEVPLQFKVIDRSEADWVKLRDALANVRISARYEEEPDPTLASFLASAAANNAVAQAKAGLDTHGAAVKEAWNTAVKPQ